MLSLRTTSPFDLLERLEQQLQTAERVPAAEVHQTAEAYEVVLELPGVDKSAIEVKATDRTLVISAERRSSHPLPAPSLGEARAEVPEQDEKPARGALLSEFRYGTWSRSFRFPVGINREGLEAHYRDGLLTVKLPKAQTLTTVKVNVEA
jgi:HSP20 family protein